MTDEASEKGPLRARKLREPGDARWRPSQGRVANGDERGVHLPIFDAISGAAVPIVDIPISYRRRACSCIASKSGNKTVGIHLAGPTPHSPLFIASAMTRSTRAVTLQHWFFSNCALQGYDKARKGLSTTRRRRLDERPNSFPASVERLAEEDKDDEEEMRWPGDPRSRAARPHCVGVRKDGDHAISSTQLLTQVTEVCRVAMHKVSRQFTQIWM